jgi:hypothetical protein
VAILTAMSLQAPLRAQTVPDWAVGNIKTIFADPSDVILEMNTVSPCGGYYLHIYRSATNFQELVSLMYTAAATGKAVRLWIVSCNGQRAVVSHGQAIFQ